MNNKKILLISFILFLIIGYLLWNLIFYYYVLKEQEINYKKLNKQYQAGKKIKKEQEKKLWKLKSKIGN